MSFSNKLQKAQDCHAITGSTAVLKRSGQAHLGCALIAGVVLTAASQVGAVPISGLGPIITYTWTGIGSGTLGGKSFVNQAITVTAEAYASQVSPLGTSVFGVADFTSSITIAGLGVASFTDQMETVLNQNNNTPTVPEVGFSDLTEGKAIIFETNPTFNAYNLGYSDSGTSATKVQLSPYDTFATSIGNLSLTSVVDANFSAAVAVPDASGTLAMLSISAASLFLLRKKFDFGNAI